jgi:hypothetical protein
MKYIVPTTFVDLKVGVLLTVPFYADTADRALLLSDALRTLMGKGGGIESHGGRDQSHLCLRGVLDPARVDP